MQNWDDLRVFLAVARHRTYQDASDAILMDPTTIARRLDRLEKELKCTLLTRGPRGHSLTATGKRLLDAASRMELAHEELSDRHGTAATAGRVRISTSEGFGTAILSPAVPALIAQRPTVEIEIVANPGYLSPALREVDLAITLAAPQDKRLAVERLTDYQLGLYAANSYVLKNQLPKKAEDLRKQTLIGYIDDLLYANELRYLDEIANDLNPAVSSSSIRSQLEMVRAGVGIAVLPCFMAEAVEPRLTRLLGGTVSVTRTFWMSARRDVQQTSRVKRVRNWVQQTVAKQKPLLLPD